MSECDQQFIEAKTNARFGQPQNQRAACILVALTMALLFSSLGLMSHPQVAKASYGCGNASGGHCYARTFWNRSTPGAQVSIQVVILTCTLV